MDPEQPGTSAQSHGAGMQAGPSGAAWSAPLNLALFSLLTNMP